MKYIALLAFLFAVGCASSKPQPTAAASPAWKPTATAPAMNQPSPTTAKAMSSDGQKLSCSKDKEVRMLEIVKKDKGCDLNYTKAGKMTAVASSSVSSKHCEASESKIRAKLETAGYKCQ